MPSIHRSRHDEFRQLPDEDWRRDRNDFRSCDLSRNQLLFEGHVLYRLPFVMRCPFMVSPGTVTTISRSFPMLVMVRGIVHEVTALRRVTFMMMRGLSVDHLPVHLREVPPLQSKDLSPCHRQEGEAHGKSLLKQKRHGKIAFSNAAARQPLERQKRPHFRARSIRSLKNPALQLSAGTALVPLCNPFILWSG